MTFKVGDWVRRRKDCASDLWKHGFGPIQVVRLAPNGEIYLRDVDCHRNPDLFELATEPLDPHALGMALQLADLLDLEDGNIVAFREFRAGMWEAETISNWLRAEVQCELLSQETPRGRE